MPEVPNRLGDHSQLALALKNTLAAEENARKMAETFLQASLCNERHVVELLEISSSPKIDNDVRLASSIRLKNIVGKYYNSENVAEMELIKDPQREVLRGNIFRCVSEQTDMRIRRTILDIANTIIRKDFPAKK